MIFCHCVCVSAGILPPHTDSHALVGRYRAEQFEDVSAALTAMRFVNAVTPPTELYLRMYQLEIQQLPRRSELRSPVSSAHLLWVYSVVCQKSSLWDVCVQEGDEHHFLAVARAMEEIVDDPVDCYWLIKCFVNQFHHKFGDSLPHLVSAHGSLNICTQIHS